MTKMGKPGDDEWTSEEDAIESISDASMGGLGLGSKNSGPTKGRAAAHTRSANHHEGTAYGGYSGYSARPQYGGTGGGRSSYGRGYGCEGDGGYDEDGFYDTHRRSDYTGSPYGSSSYGSGSQRKPSVDEAVQVAKMTDEEKLSWHVRKAQEHLMDAMDASGFIVVGGAAALELKRMIDHDMAEMLKKLLKDAEEFGHVRKV